jgi:quercetin dioxygenase-like cupin family protein
MTDAIVPISGKQLSLPKDPIFHLQRADESDYDIGEFRAWAGYKNLGIDKATNGVAHLQQVLSFAGTDQAGRTGIHAHFAHAQIVIPTSGHGIFSYDGVETEAVPGAVIAQHGGTIHDQFSYSYAAESADDNRKTPLTIEPYPPNTPPRSFSFLELFVPQRFANVEIVPPHAVTDADQCTAWDHPYHAQDANYSIQLADTPDAVFRPLAHRPDLEARDAATWEASGKLVATWFIRPASGESSQHPAISLGIAGEKGGFEILYMINGSARFLSDNGKEVQLRTGDTLTCSQGMVGDPFDCSADMRLVRFFISAKAETLKERTPEEIKRLEALGPQIITRREVRPAGDTRPVNCLREKREVPAEI